MWLLITFNYRRSKKSILRIGKPSGVVLATGLHKKEKVLKRKI
jgi:hypothetical protein